MISAGIQDALAGLLGEKIEAGSVKPLGGGCIHQACRFEAAEQTWFLKHNHIGEAANFKAEKLGLETLAATGAIRVPQSLVFGQTVKEAFLLMEFVESGPRTSKFWTDFGHSLANLHRQTQPCFGLGTDNFIGRLPQSNQENASWPEFFINQRLQPLVKRAFDSGLLDAAHVTGFDDLIHKISQLIPTEPPALLHGDLWSGNFLCDAAEQPVLIDPAVYYGHREAEIAFTRMFGGFSPLFYDAYAASYPLEPGWQDREELFNLYPLLVHLNLFGKSYLAEIEWALRKYR